MFLTIVALGLRDTIKNWRKLVAMVIILIAAGVVVVSATRSLIRDKNVIFKVSYAAIPISTDLFGMDEIVDKLELVLSKGGCTFFYSDVLSQKMEFPVVVIIGKLCKGDNNDFGWVVPTEAYESIATEEFNDIKKLLPEDMKEETLEMLGLKKLLTDESVTLLTFKNDTYKHFNNYDLSLEEIISIVENICFSINDLNEGIVDEFERVMDNDAFWLKRLNYSMPEEKNFIYLYIGVHSVLSLMVILLFFILTLRDYFNKMRDNYLAHMIYGSQLKAIYGRLLTSIFVVNGVVFIFMAITSFFDPQVIVPAVGYMIITDIILGLLAFFVLRKEKLNDLSSAID